MKTLFITLTAFMLSLSAWAQNPFETIGFLGDTREHVMKVESSLVGDTLGLNVSLQSVRNNPDNNGKIVIYKTVINGQTSTLDMYYFNKADVCYLFRTVQDMDNLPEQLNFIAPYFNRRNENSFYHKNLNIKMVYHIEPKDKVVIFNYARKSTVIPKYY